MAEDLLSEFPEVDDYQEISLDQDEFWLNQPKS